MGVNFELDMIKPVSVTFNWFWFYEFIKCFGIEMNDIYKKGVKSIMKAFKQNDFLDGSNWKENHLYFLIHYPAQLLLTNLNVKRFETDRTKMSSYLLDVTLKGVEILQRRDKRRDRCTKDVARYDELVLYEHIKGNGCRAPYQNAPEEFSICSTRKQIEQSLYDLNAVHNKYYPPPCESVSKIDFDITEFEFNVTGEKMFSLSVVFTDEMKIISQSKAVDINSFIGNIGGYIGLFLGKLIFSTFV